MGVGRPSATARPILVSGAQVRIIILPFLGLGGGGHGKPHACADLIIAAQAFHCFHLDRTFAEVQRIGTPRSACVVFWNVRLEDTPFIWL